MNYTDKEIEIRLDTALRTLYLKDSHLLKNSVHERSLTHKLAEYLQQLFPEYNVDCEYNLDIDDESKRKKWVSEKAKEKLIELLNEFKTIKTENWNLSEEIEKVSKNFYPDIIVHKRGSNKNNLFVIEAKKNGADTSFDKEKLIAFTNNKDKIHRYKYQLGAIVSFDVGKEITDFNFTKPIYFKNGEEAKQKK